MALRVIHRFVLSTLMVAVLASSGCWSWSFPEEELRHRDSGADATSLDAVADSDMVSDLSMDGRTEASIDASPPCTPADCNNPTPFCDPKTSQCRACEAHVECALYGDLCALAGTCPDPDDIAYVDKDGCSRRTPDGKPGSPWCTLDEANGDTKKYVLVRGSGPYGDVTFNSDHELYAEKRRVTTIAPTDCDKLLIEGGVTVALVGFVIANEGTGGGVRIKGGSKATLVDNTIGPSPCEGVHSNEGSTVILERSFIYKNKKGGVHIDGPFAVVNNIIVKNGGSDTTWGGAKLKPGPAGQKLFINNTVADNIAKEVDKINEVGGVRCEAPLMLVNSILWGNTFNITIPINRRQYSPDCTLDHCDEQRPIGALPPALPNLGVNPMFASSAPDTAADYHLHKTLSKLKDAGVKNSDTPPVDYDNQPRDPNPDIGADEIFP